MNFKKPRIQTQSIVESIRRIVRSLRVSSRAAEKELGISGAQLFVLQKLKEGRACSLRQLAQQTLTDPSSVSVVVTKLAQRGLIRREMDAGDGRRLELGLTPKGKQFMRGAVAPIAQERLISAIEALPDRDRTELARILEKVTRESGLSGERAAFFFEEEGPRT